AHAARDFLRKSGLESVESDEVDCIERAFARFGLGNLLGPEAKLDIGEHGQPWKQSEALKDHADALDGTMYRLTEKRHRPRGGGKMRPDTIRKSEDLPQPERPNRPTISSPFKSSDILSRTAGPSSPAPVR